MSTVDYVDNKKNIEVESDKKDDMLKLSRANEIIGCNVKNIDGDKLGKIDDIVVDIYKGGFSYAVVSSGGFLGLGNKLIAVPWEILNFDQRDNSFVLKIHHSKLENAPGIDIENLNNMNSKKWAMNFLNHYRASWGHLSTFSGEMWVQDSNVAKVDKSEDKENL